MSDSKNIISTKKKGSLQDQTCGPPFSMEAVVYFDFYYAAKYGFNVVNML